LLFKFSLCLEPVVEILTVAAAPLDTVPPPGTNWLVVSSIWQIASQPSPGVVLLSSHCSVPSIVPSPQTVRMVVLVVDEVVVTVLDVGPLHEAMQEAATPSLETLNVLASLGFGVADAVPPQY